MPQKISPNYRRCITAQNVTCFNSQSEYVDTIKRSREKRETLKHEGIDATVVAVRHSPIVLLHAPNTDEKWRVPATNHF